MNKQTLIDTLHLHSLTPMQEAMNEAGLRNESVVLLSPTGSGKTLAYLLPLTETVTSEADTLQAVVVVPTRELACQSEEVLKSMKSGLRTMSLYGGRPAMEEHRKLKEVKPQVIFATPGRFLDHIGKENITAEAVRLLVIDEFDKCLELGFQDEMHHVIEQMEHVRRCWLLSATDSDEIPEFMNCLAPKFERLDYLSVPPTGNARIQTYQVPSPEKDKLRTLAQLLSHIGGAPAIVFVSYRESAERVAQYLHSERFAVEMYHGGMEQERRERALYKFRNGSANVLVSTDLAARGIDIPEVRAVVHYHLPVKEEDYIHRNGRTARWQADGSIYLITSPGETLPEFVHTASELLVSSSDALHPTPPLYTTIYIGRGKKEKLSKGDILGFFCKKGGLNAKDMGRIDIQAHSAYVAIKRNKVKSLLQAVSGEKIKGMKTLIEEMRH